MCKICKKAICPANCRSFVGENARERALGCVMCGDLIDAERGYYQKNGFPYCRVCIEYAEIDTLVRICEIDKRKWLEAMGFEWNRS